MQSERVSLRQAVVVLPMPVGTFAASRLGGAFSAEQRKSILKATLLDVLGALVRVDGVTLALIVPPTDADRALLTDLPAGIEMITAGLGDRGPVRLDQLLQEALRVLLDRQFGRIVTVAGDAIRLQPRIVATALSALGSAALLVGPTRGGAGYLIGIKDETGMDVLAGGATDADLPFGGADLLPRVEARRLIARRVEPLPRFLELDGREALVAAVTREPALNPRLAAVLQIRWI